MKLAGLVNMLLLRGTVLFTRGKAPFCHFIIMVIVLEGGLSDGGRTAVFLQ